MNIEKRLWIPELIDGRSYESQRSNGSPANPEIHEREDFVQF